MSNRNILIIVALVVVLIVVGYTSGWFGGATPDPAAVPAAPATGTTQ